MGAHRLDGLRARKISGGMKTGELAQKAQVNTHVIHVLENGGTCNPDISARVLNALGNGTVTLVSNTQASPTVFTTAAPHYYVTGDTVTIAGNTGSNADPNGSRVVTVVDGTSFSVPINCTTAGGTGGTAVLTSAQGVTLVSLV